MERDAATRILGLASECSRKIDESVATVMESCDTVELVAYRRHAGMIMASIFENMMAPIYDEFEDLAPEWYRAMNSKARSTK
jgi:hypothetical protein